MNLNTRGTKILGLLELKTPLVRERNVVDTANFSPPPLESLPSGKIPVFSSEDDVFPTIQTLPTTTASNVNSSFEDLITQAEIVTNTDGIFDPELVEVEGYSTGATVHDNAYKNYDPKEGPSYSVVVDEETPTIIRLTKIIHNQDGNDPSASRSNDDEQVDDENPNSSDDSDWHESENSAESSDSKHSSPLEFSRKPNLAPLENFSHEEDEMRQKRGKRKKRPCNPDNWVMKKTKTLRNSDLGYVSYKSKRSVSARKIRPSCESKCRLKCSEKIKEEVRQQLFSGFWSLGDVQRQREFIVSYSDEIKPKYRYSSTQNFRAMKRAFYFDVHNVRTRVCKQFFMATLDINARTIQTAFSKKSSTGFVAEDRRVKHNNHPTVDPEIKESVHQFINSIPRIESHYLRAQTSRELIEGGKSLADLFRDYKAGREQKELPSANSIMFNRIFHSEFNISFFKPKKDQCDVCESYSNANDEEKESMRATFEKHKKETELSRAEKGRDKDNPCGAIVAVFDLQAVMPSPRGLVSSFYYKSKLNCFNFIISDLHTRNVNCYFWNETEAKRGANEIGSCVYLYLKDLKEQRSDVELD
ncbi:uncharacterized protein LOC130452104, partial [Diorhabda sublineata]|uniref:uncharacterized protein LOC130452104 n=1 Tax=Diorhabda sublineata TaxID=1163346 RepID=UPI0024E193D5